MAAYKMIQDRVRQVSGYTPKTCWIAHVMSDRGLTQRIAPNRIDLKSRRHPCPDSKRAAIEEALQYFGTG